MNKKTQTPAASGKTHCSAKGRIPSYERGCKGKINLGRSYKKQADRLSSKHEKIYGVYQCPHCEGYHLTTKMDKVCQYAPILYISEPNTEPATCGHNQKTIMTLEPTELESTPTTPEAEQVVSTALLAKLVLTLDAYEGRDALVSNQGQAMDGYSALANFKSIAEEARDLLANTQRCHGESK